MWCPGCKSDVAAEVSTETGRVQCASCGVELAQADGIRERTKDAREILERWSSKSMLDPYGPLPGSRARRPDRPQTSAMAGGHAGSSESSTSHPEPEVPRPRTRSRQPVTNREDSHTDVGPDSQAAQQTSGSARTYRIDSPQGVRDVSQSENRVRAHRRPTQRRLDEPHGKQLSGPHFQVAPPKQPSWMVATGQWLAYIGVLALTIGTAVVVYGHVTGAANYTPTGWLITTVGQMLLFLGVINLVHGAMEQSKDEVSHRIEVIGERLLRIQAETGEALRGPRIPAERYAEGEITESQATTAKDHVQQ